MPHLMVLIMVPLVLTGAIAVMMVGYRIGKRQRSDEEHPEQYGLSLAGIFLAVWGLIVMGLIQLLQHFGLYPLN